MYNYTVKAGDNLNTIAQAHGFSNYKDAGITSVPSGNFDKINVGDTITIPNYKNNQVSTLPVPTAPVISSTDNQQQYKTDSTTIDGLIGSLNKKVDPVTGQDISTKDTTTTDPNTGLPVTKTDTSVTTGNTLHDSLMKEAETQKAQIQAKYDQSKIEYQNLFNTSLANLNATTQNTINQLNVTYDKRIQEQQRINNLNTSRVQAYGLANGGQYTPIAFSDAITNREREGADLITNLNNERNALIEKAKIARDNGETALMRQSLTDLQTIDNRINTELQNVQATSEKNYQDLRNARVDAENQHKAKVAEALTALTATAGSMADAYSKMDDTNKNATIKKIMVQTGLDYGSVFATLEGAVAKKATSALDLQTKQQAIDLKQSQIDKNNRVPVKTVKPVTPKVVKPTKQSVYGDINNLINDNVSLGGTPTVDANGFINPQAFEKILQVGAGVGITRKALFDTYKAKLYDGDGAGDYSAYGIE